MNLYEFITDISWQVVTLLGLIVLLVYKKPLSNLITNIKRASWTKGEASASLEVDRPVVDSGKTDFVDNQLSEIDKTSLEIQKTEIEYDSNLLEQESETWITLSSKGQYQKAREMLLESISQLEAQPEPPTNYIYWLRVQAIELLYKDDYQKGIAEFESSLKIYPDTLAFYRGYIDILEGLGDFDKIYSLIDAYPGNKSNKCILMLAKARLLNMSSDYDKATEIINQLLTQTDNIQIKAQAYIVKGNMLKKDNLDEAKKCFIRAYKTLPMDFSVLSSVAESLSEIKESSLELFFRRQLVDLEKSDSTFGYLGNVYLKLDFNSHALVAYEKANELSSGIPVWINANIGNLYNNIGLHHKAVDFLKIANAEMPTYEYGTARLSTALAKIEISEKKIQEILDSAKTLIAKTDVE